MRSNTLPIHYAWAVLAVGTLSIFGLLGLGRFGYALVLPAMQHGLSLSNTQTGLLATANLIGYLALAALGGALASHWGPRRTIVAGLVLAGVGMVLTGTARSFAGAAAWRTLTGIGSGAGNVSVMGMLAAWFASRRRGMAAGVAVSGSSLALIVLGPLVPALLAAGGESGWRACWFIFGGATLALAAIACLLLRNHPADLGLRPLGTAADEPEAGEQGGSLPWRLVYRSAPMWHLGLVYVAFGFSYIIYMTFFAKRLVSEGGYTPAEAGRLFMIIGWLSLFSGLAWGSLSDRIGRRGTLVMIYLLQAAALACFALWPSPHGFTLSAVLFGLTAWSIPAIMAAACGDVLGPRLAPAALGFITLFFGVGQAVGPGIAGRMADSFGSFAPAFLLAGVVSLLGAAGAAMLRPASTACGPIPGRITPRAD